AYLPISSDGTSPVLAALGVILLFEGRQGACSISGLGVDITVKPDCVLFNQMMPRNLYQTGCVHTLYDTGCTMLKADFTFSFTVDSSPTSVFLPWTSAPSPFAPFGLGSIVMTSGAANGQI